MSKFTLSTFDEDQWTGLKDAKDAIEQLFVNCTLRCKRCNGNPADPNVLKIAAIKLLRAGMLCDACLALSQREIKLAKIDKARDRVVQRLNTRDNDAFVDALTAFLDMQDEAARGMTRDSTRSW